MLVGGVAKVTQRRRAACGCAPERRLGLPQQLRPRLGRALALDEREHCLQASSSNVAA